MRPSIVLFVAFWALSGRAEDMQKYLNDTYTLVQQGKYEQALERFIWFHEHALEHDPGMSGVRLSFALSDWKELADEYPPAKIALVDTRDQAVKELTDKKGSWERFQEAAAINRVLGRNEETVELFESLDKDQAELAELCWGVAKDSVIAAKRYDLVGKYMPDLLGEFARIKKFYDLNVALYNDSRINGASFKKYNEESFVDDSLQLIEVAIALKQPDAAKQVQEKALTVLDARRLREALPTSK